MKRYNPKELEPKWQKTWADSKLYQAVDFDKTRPKYVMLTEFPYPSGDGLHMGHVREYTLGDVIARYKRMNGHNVLYPMGYDAFGLPTENYAIKNKIAPQVATDVNVANFQKQFNSLGYSIDWDRSFKTTDPDYYKWTQWLFLQFFKEGLAYQDKVAINWCPHCKTGLANEEVINGRHERCDTLVEKKTLKQWMLKITQYADRLIEGLQDVDYPSRIADQQVNWIGRSVGAEVDFAVDEDPNYVALHGFTAQAKDDFYAWLKVELEKRGHKAYVPNMPNTDKPDAKEQAKYVLENAKFDENTVLLGHSYGSVTALRIVEQLKTPIKKLVLVAGFAEPGFLDNERNFEKTTDWDFDFEKIKANAGEIVLLRAKNDTAVPQERTDYLQKHLGGTIVDFKAEANHVTGKIEPVVLQHALSNIRVFTTRPDTLFGATFVVLAPEHPLVAQITTTEHKANVNSYIKAAQGKSEIERQDTNREKTGVFTGAHAINPVNGEKVPIWIADYVLTGYGTGAIMAVPAHDERDYEFAKKFEIPIKQVIIPEHIDKEHPTKKDLPLEERLVAQIIVQHPEDGSYLMLKLKGWETETYSLPIGGVDKGEKAAQAVLRELKEETGFHNHGKVEQVGEPYFAQFYHELKKVNRRAKITTFHTRLKSLDQLPVSEEEKAKHSLSWVGLDELYDRLHGQGVQALVGYFRDGGSAVTGEGEMINSGKYDGTPSSEARDKIVADLVKAGKGEEKINYRLRDWIFSRQHYWGEPIPIIHCAKDGAVAVPEDQLPVTLPKVEQYEPTDNGESPLAAITDWVNVACPKCDGDAMRETDTMPNWAGSSWYYLRYYDAHNSKAFADPKNLEYWGEVDMYLGGMEHTTLHLLYSRFWHQFFYDQALVPTPEPYAARRGQGIILAADGTKMSKSKGNVVNPTEVIEAGYGADALRLAIAFLAPYDQTTPWSPESVAGTHRFINRVWTLTQEYLDAKPKAEEDKALLVPVHKAIKKISQDLHTMSFNTAIAALMETTNELYKIKAEKGFVAGTSWQFAIETLLQLLAPFAPHIAEELWHELGHKESIHTSTWPIWDEQYLMTDSMKIVVQVNGKVRAQLSVPTDSSKEAVIKAAQADTKVAGYLEGKDVKKTIYVPGKLVSFVVSS